MECPSNIATGLGSDYESDFTAEEEFILANLLASANRDRGTIPTHNLRNEPFPRDTKLPRREARLVSDQERNEPVQLRDQPSYVSQICLQSPTIPSGEPVST